MKVKELFLTIAERIYPYNYSCYSCGREMFTGQAFCKDCRSQLVKLTTICPRCGRKVVQNGYCLDCKREQPAFEKARSLYSYEGAAVGLIHSFKNGKSHLAKAFAIEGEKTVRRLHGELLCFVPSSKRAFTGRGYNPAQLLAEEIGKRCHLPVEDLFEKTRDTPAQKALTKEERAKNLKGSFHVKKRTPVKEKRVVLVDDVLTTGATVSELTRLLLGAGAKSVQVFTIASVMLRGGK